MKNFLLCLSTILFSVAHSFSQDVITKTSGEEIEAAIIEVNETEISFKKMANPDGPVYIIGTNEILMIRYENGTKDVFNQKIENTITNSDNMYFKGHNDAIRYYRGYKGAGTGTLVAGIVSPLLGLVPAIITSSTSPKGHNLNYPHSDLMKNRDYYNGYTQQAKKIKQGKVWKNWGIAFGVNLAVVLLVAAGQ